MLVLNHAGLAGNFFLSFADDGRGHGVRCRCRRLILRL
jgi:hypothetical protein